MLEKLNRLFTGQQRVEHQELHGKGCDWIVDHQRCGRTPVEFDHAQPYGKGGQTVEENAIASCRPHHAIKHLLDNEAYAARLIESRMTQAELAMYWMLREELGL